VKVARPQAEIFEWDVRLGTPPSNGVEEELAVQFGKAKVLVAPALKLAQLELVAFGMKLKAVGAM
jgi:hypothetical protein